MRIKIKLFATLRDGRDKILDNEYPEGTSIRRILEDLAIEEKDVAILLLNGRDTTLDQLPGEDDIISIFPPVGGG
ncbi:MAG TPA: MoaD/ThiS family protein [Clostridiaceae bacterium]|nr:MoaD/ThiS family protein [Clostridiaceae bacterium]